MAFLQYQLGSFQDKYDRPIWGLFEYLTLFSIVLMHEFGHSLACRSVGGRADHIMLWPLGGVALVSPPRRPWPVLWSIVAGPLVNVILLPVFWTLAIFAETVPGLSDADLGRYLFNVAVINTVLLVFNLLPIYPMDGGQILQSLLWFLLGQARSLMVAAIIGLVLATGLGLLAVMFQRWALLVLVVFLVMQALEGVRIARFLLTQERQGGGATFEA